MNAVQIGLGLRVLLEQHPTDVRPPKPALRVVGVFIVIRLGVMLAMVRGPLERRVLDRGGAEQQIEQSYRPNGLVGRVREEPVIPTGDGEPTEGHPQKPEADRPPREVNETKVKNRARRK